MSYAQMLEEQDYSVSANFDRFDGFDRGDIGTECRDQGSECIGRMQAEWNGKVEVFYLWDNMESFYQVVLTFNDDNGRQSVYERATRAEALSYAKWWLDGCPR